MFMEGFDLAKRCMKSFARNGLCCWVIEITQGFVMFGINGVLVDFIDLIGINRFGCCWAESVLIHLMAGTIG